MRHYRIRRYGRRRLTGREAAAAVAAGGLLAMAAHHGGGTSGGQAQASTVTTAAAATAIAYARSQLGKPYLWGGTGPDAFDCSGLAQMAYRSAGVDIARTSQDQWATEPHVSSPQPGDLVFFAGADGTGSSPGHVGIVTGPHTMIEAYGTGYPIRYSQFGTAASPPGDGNPVGFTDPAAHAGAS
jgi:cell wall-associated NlpC family hydrolase